MTEEVQPWRHWRIRTRTGQEMPALSTRAFNALYPFRTVSEVKVRELLRQPGCGRQTTRDIAETFVIYGFTDLHDEWLAFQRELWDPYGKGSRNHVKQQERNRRQKALRDAEKVVIEAAVALFDDPEEFVSVRSPLCKAVDDLKAARALVPDPARPKGVSG